MRRRPSLALGLCAFALSGLVVWGVAGGTARSQEAQPPSLPVPPPPPGPPSGALPQVSEPEPAPNPVRDQQAGPGLDDTGGGIDPELGPIAEPDAGDAGPASVLGADGAWETPDELARRRAREEAQRLASEALAGAEAASGGVMPRLVGPTIPIVPLALLFPPEVQVDGPREVREIRGTQATLVGADRSSGQVRRFVIPVGREATFGSLRIQLSGCYRSNPDDPFEAWAFVDVTDRGRPPIAQLAVLPQRERARRQATQGPRQLRRGWIIASSPTVTPIDHPVYDVFLASCDGDAGGPAPVAQVTDGAAPVDGTAPRPARPTEASVPATTDPAETAR